MPTTTSTPASDTSGNARLERILAAEQKIHELNHKAKPWVEGKAADDLICEAREERFRKKGYINDSTHFR